MGSAGVRGTNQAWGGRRLHIAQEHAARVEEERTVGVGEMASRDSAATRR